MYFVGVIILLIVMIKTGKFTKDLLFYFSKHVFRKLRLHLQCVGTTVAELNTAN